VFSQGLQIRAPQHDEMRRNIGLETFPWIGDETQSTKTATERQTMDPIELTLSKKERKPSPQAELKGQQELTVGQQFVVSHPKEGEPLEELVIKLCWGQSLRIIAEKGPGESSSSPDRGGG